MQAEKHQSSLHKPNIDQIGKMNLQARSEITDFVESNIEINQDRLFGLQQSRVNCARPHPASGVPEEARHVFLPPLFGSTRKKNDENETLRRPKNSKLNPPDLPHLRVMLADDHVMVREGLANLLRDQFDLELVGEAADGLQALEMAKATEPDVILMDVNMPRLNGIEATRRIKQSLPRVHIIGLSMHQEGDMARAMRKAGAADYLSKDTPGFEIVEAIRAASHLK